MNEASMYTGEPSEDRDAYSDVEGRFTIVMPADSDLEHFLRMDEYSVANAFVKGDITVRGDLCAAIRFFRQQERPLLRQLWFALTAGLVQFTSSLLSGRNSTGRTIRFHYDRSDAFYRQFLDARMLYSAADFSEPNCSLEQAQTKKLNQICIKLDLHPSERFLDVGCGWGALVVHAVERFGVTGVGCTLSHHQLEFARSVVRDHCLEGRATIEGTDYRNLRGRYEKIASIGMFEHVGRKHLSEYFRKIYSLLEPGGVFLNRGIVRPETVSIGPATLFLKRKVFPGGGLVRLANVVQEAERAGFGVLEVQDLRRNYARTCRAWVSRLLQTGERCRLLVGEETYRTWLLYLAASAASFERRHDRRRASHLREANRFVPRGSQRPTVGIETSKRSLEASMGPARQRERAIDTVKNRFQSAAPMRQGQLSVTRGARVFRGGLQRMWL